MHGQGKLPPLPPANKRFNPMEMAGGARQKCPRRLSVVRVGVGETRRLNSRTELLAEPVRNFRKLRRRR